MTFDGLACAEREKRDDFCTSTQETIVSEDVNDYAQHVVLLSCSIYDLHYHRYSKLPHSDIIKHLFLSCESCRASGKTICIHADILMLQGLVDLRREFSSTKYGHHSVDNVPLTVQRQNIPEDLSRWFVSYNVKGDGNCFFSAVSFCMHLDPCFGKALRRCGYLRLQHSSELKSKTDRLTKVEINKQLQILSTDGVWASSHTFFVISDVISRPIIVYSYNRNNNQIFGTKFDARTYAFCQPIFLWLEGNHFSPLILRDSSRQPSPAVYEPGDVRRNLGRNELQEYLKTCGILHSSNDVPTVTLSDSDSGDHEVDEMAKHGAEVPPSTNAQCKPETSNCSKFNRFTKKDDGYFRFVLKHLKVDLEELQNSSKQSIMRFIGQCVASTESWDTFTQRQIRHRNLSLSKTKNICRTVYLKQRTRSGRQQFLEMMSAAGVSEEGIQLYIDLCNSKFGVVSLPPMRRISDCRTPEQHMSPEDTDVSERNTVHRHLEVTTSSPLDHGEEMTQKSTGVATAGSRHKMDPGHTPNWDDPDTNPSLRQWYAYKPNTNLEEEEQTVPINPDFDNQKQMDHGAANIKNFPVKIMSHEAPNARERGNVARCVSQELWSQLDVKYEAVQGQATDLVSATEKLKNILPGLTATTAPAAGDHQLDSSGSLRLTFSTNEEGEVKCKTETMIPNMSLNSSSEARARNDNEVLTDAICQVLHISKSDLDHQPPQKFKIKLTPSEMEEMFDFESNKLRERIWPIVISRGLTRAIKVCCFNAVKSPVYKKTGRFCKLSGKCSGHCMMKFTVIIRRIPVKGKSAKCSVLSSGTFKLLQQKSTGRQLRGHDRTDMKEKLKLTKAKATFLRNIQDTPALQALHRHHAQKSEAALRKARSEIKKDSRLDEDPGKEILLLKQKFIDQDVKHKICRGYIQQVNITPGCFELLMYTRDALLFHDAQVKLGYNVCFLDASGGFVGKLSEKTPLLYVLMGRNYLNISYPIAEFIAENGTNIDVMACLVRVKQQLLALKGYTDTPFTNVLVVDWSWSLIHAACKAINTHELEDYINESWAVLTGGEWKKKHACIFICTSHLISAAKRHFSKKLTKSKVDKAILSAALDALARLQESFDLVEFKYNITVIVRTFGMEYIGKEELDRNIQHLSAKKYGQEEFVGECDPEAEEPNVYPDEEICSKSLRGRSPFFKLFQEIEVNQIKNPVDRKGLSKNCYYCPAILKAIGEHKVPMFPFWGSAVPRTTQKADFFRESNAVVESSFNLRKHIYNTDKNQLYTDYAKESRNYHLSTLRDAVDKILQKAPPSSPSKHNKSTELQQAIWKRRTLERNSKHFTPIPSQLSPSTLKDGDNRNGKQKSYQRVDKSTPPATTKPLPRGLPNIGATCYLNAILQMVMYLPVTIQKNSQDPFLLPFELFFEGIHGKHITEAALLLAKDDIDILTEFQFPTGIQHDPHEFFNYLLTLDEFQYLKTSLLVELMNTVKCLGCSYESAKTEYEHQLILPANNEFTNFIAKFQQQETLDDYRCTHCGSKAVKTTRITSTSDYLLLVTQLADNNDPVLRRRLKVPIKKEHRAADSSVDILIGTEYATYDLMSFITHEGLYMDSGHCRTYHADGGKYICCDDSRVTQCNRVFGDVYIRIYKKKI